MVEFSLKKAKAAWKIPSSPSKKKVLETSPYDSFKDPVSLPKINDKDKEKVGKMMQRRLSVHNGRLPDIDLSNAPAMPSMPDMYHIATSTSSMDRSIQQGDAGSESVPGTPDGGSFDPNASTGQLSLQRSLDMLQSGAQPLYKHSTSSTTNLTGKTLKKILTDEDFDANQFVSTKFGNATASDIDRFTSNLYDLSMELTMDLNKMQDLSSREIVKCNQKLQDSKLEMATLKTALEELCSVLSSMTKSTDARSSMIALENMWDLELQAMFKAVHGSSKMISMIPGRHILCESGEWYEINVATLKPIASCHFFVLNDHLLIATRPQMEADKCWPIKDVVIQEDRKQKILLVKVPQFSYLYQCRTESAFDSVMGAYRKAKEEVKKNNNLIRQSSRVMSWHARSRSKDHSASKLRGLDLELEQFDVDVSRQDYKHAAQFILDSEKILSTVEDDESHGEMKANIQERRQLLEESLAKQVDSLVYLKPLNLNKAIEAFFSIKSHEISQLLLKIMFNNDVEDYVTQISIVRFQLLKGAVLDFLDIFPKSLSKLVKWCASEVDRHFQLLRKQLYTDETFSTCIKISRKQIDELKTVGMDFVYKLDEFINAMN